MVYGWPEDTVFPSYSYIGFEARFITHPFPRTSLDLNSKITHTSNCPFWTLIVIYAWKAEGKPCFLQQVMVNGDLLYMSTCLKRLANFLSQKETQKVGGAA